MKKFFSLGVYFKRSCIEILPNKEIEGAFLHEYLQVDDPRTKYRLPDSIVFHIKACKKEYDIIVTYDCWTVIYYSKELISILNRFTDMSDKCYRINLPDATKEYFAIYNLKSYQRINLNEYKVKSSDPDFTGYTPIRFVIGKEDLGPIFAASPSKYILISEDMMKAIKKAKLTNVEFREAYAYTPEEALEWAKENPQFADDFTDKEWFRELLKK